MPAPIQNSDSGSLACTYPTGGVNSVEINYQVTPPGTTAASFEAELTSQGSGAKFAPVSGYGQAAFTNTGAGIATIAVLDSGVEISIGGGTSMPGVLALTKTVLAG